MRTRNGRPAAAAMHRGARLALMLGLAVATVAGRAASAPFEWPVSSPESQGMSTARLDTLWTDLKARSTSR